MGKSKNVHDKIIYDLEQRLRRNNTNYDLIDKNLVFGNMTRNYGEIDLYAHNRKYMLFFEIKTSYTKKNHRKAIRQLTGIKDRFASGKLRSWYFYVHGSNDNGYTIKQIKI